MTCLPVRTHSIALNALISLGARTVPPNPGQIPRFTSGNPSTALSLATRKSVARHISSPPPRAIPLIAVTVGMARSSTALKISLVRAAQSINCCSLSLNFSVNSLISAPTRKLDLALAHTRARASLAATAAIASDNSCSIRLLKTLTTEPGRSNTRRAMPDGRLLT